MAEYIEKEALLSDNIFLAGGFVGDEFAEGYMTALDDLEIVIRALPAADVRENVSGDWIRYYETTSDNEEFPYGWECSLCGRWEMEKQPFCNCGAQMTGGAEDEEDV